MQANDQKETEGLNTQITDEGNETQLAQINSTTVTIRVLNGPENYNLTRPDPASGF